MPWKETATGRFIFEEGEAMQLCIMQIMALQLCIIQKTCLAGDRYTEHTFHSRRHKHVGRLEGQGEPEKEKRRRQVWIEEISKKKSKLANTFLKAKVYESFATREYSSTSSLGDLIDLSGAVQVGQIWRREKFSDFFGNSIWHSQGVDIVYSFVGYWW